MLRQGNHIVFGRNLDWITGSGLIISQPEISSKDSVDRCFAEYPITWTSKYGSITFNQVGRDLPYGGMNEAGLVVEHMTLDETVFNPSDDNRHTISACQWIQYQLDNYSTVEEVIKSDTLLRIIDPGSKIHFLVCDKAGNVVSIEFINGKMVYHTGKDLPVEVLANSNYENSINCFESNCDTQANRSLYNFCTAAHMVNQYHSENQDSIVRNAFHILNAVKQGLMTKWSIVYDVTNMKIYFKVFETPTIVGDQKIFLKPPGDVPVNIVNFRSFDFNCFDVPKVLDLDIDHSGIVNKYFTDYSTSINREFISKAFTFFKEWGANIQLGEEAFDYMSKYPESFGCIGN